MHSSIVVIIKLSSVYVVVVHSCKVVVSQVVVVVVVVAPVVEGCGGHCGLRWTHTSILYQWLRVEAIERRSE